MATPQAQPKKDTENQNSYDFTNVLGDMFSKKAIHQHLGIRKSKQKYYFIINLF